MNPISQNSDDNGHFLLCGVVFKKDLHEALSLLMSSFKEKHSLSGYENIHAFDLFEDELPKGGKVQHSVISEFFDKRISLIESSDIHVTLYV
jgi:hypothetical protein